MLRMAGAVMALLVVFASGTRAAEVELLGPARIIDGDTVEVEGETIRLLGIDAPETGQTCTDARGRARRCGVAAAEHLAALIAGRDLLCRGRERDGYGRLLARCDAGSGDIAAKMVLDGRAIVFRKFSDDYAEEEAIARKAARGLWAGTFEHPWDWRAAQWALAAQAAPVPDCPIKGNLSRDGRKLYHMPGTRDYLRTRIDTAKGERWFCDEGEAIRAGWLRAR